MKFCISSLGLAIALMSSVDTYGYSMQLQHSLSTSIVPSSTKTTFTATANPVDRRTFFFRSASVVAITAAAVATPAAAHASLLDEFGRDPSKISQTAESQTKTPVSVQPKAQSSIEPNLRSNYYYPTNKKRYLPRIKKCSDQIAQVAAALGEQDWPAVSNFAVISDDTILPLKLYTSSLTGGGTNVKVSYTKDMYKAADVFEKNHKLLVQAVQQKNAEKGSQAVQNMSAALEQYRNVARLTDEEMGDLPSVDDIRRASSRKQLGVIVRKEGE